MVDARVQKSQKALLQAGLSLINENKEVSLRDIADKAGVGRATLYRIYSSKDELVEAIALYCLHALDVAAEPIDKEARSGMHAFELMFEYLMPLLDEYQFLMGLDYFADSIPEVQRIVKQQDQELDELINFAKKEGSIDKKLPNSWVSHMVEGLFYSGWAQQKKSGSTSQESAALAYTCFKKAVKPAPFR